MKAIHIQYLLASIFVGLGGWCLIWPSTVNTLVFRPEFREIGIQSAILTGCFGAQAILGGVLMFTSVFKPQTFLIFGIIGSIPFFAFNYYFYFINPIFTEWMLLDFVGNIGILACGIFGYRLSCRETA